MQTVEYFVDQINKEKKMDWFNFERNHAVNFVDLEIMLDPKVSGMACRLKVCSDRTSPRFAFEV